jgi:KaiC/GvpD/RAD55 family RecA-like ATPase
LSNRLALPMIKELVPNGFGYGVNLLVEFDPKSVWYETSLTIAAQAVRDGIKTDYHTFQHMPNEVVEALTNFGLDVKKSEEDGTLSIIDSYTVQLGVGAGKKPTGRVHYQTQSVKLADWSIAMSQEIKAGAPQAEKKRLHIDDNTSVLLQYNDEKQLIDFWRTRSIPTARNRELAFVHSLVTGVYSDSFCRQWESLCDGIIEFKSEERDAAIKHFVRVRTMRGKSYDSRWHQLELLQNGEVTMAD